MADAPVVLREQVVTLEGWPTEIMSVDVDHSQASTKSTSKQATDRPHTLLVFFPGNPGCVGWYAPTILVEMIKRLGKGFAARGTSYAGHHTGSDSEILTQSKASKESSKHPPLLASVAWTVEGQVQHKAAFMDYILSEWTKDGPDNEPPPSSAIKNSNQQSSDSLPRLIFISHSIGAHMVERLCMIRPDILQRTIGIVHFMPFVRYAPSEWQDRVALNTAASIPQTVIAVGTGLLHCFQWLPNSSKAFIRKYFVNPTMEDSYGQDVIMALLHRASFVKYFLELGTEEVRDIPQNFDISAMRILTKQCPMHILYAANDKWAPQSHHQELLQLQQKGILPSATQPAITAKEPSSSFSTKEYQPYIATTYRNDLKHDFVTSNAMVDIAIDWCYQSVQTILVTTTTRTTSTTSPNANSSPLHSRL